MPQLQARNLKLGICLLTPMKTLNEVYSRLSTRRRYEVWFLRMGLADGSGAWWFRYLLTNPGRGGCAESVTAAPVQVWATYFPRGKQPQSFIQGFSLDDLSLSAKGKTPFHFAVAENAIDENSCRGKLHVAGHNICWDLQYESNFRTTLSNKGWIGFSRTPHSDARFSGKITSDNQTFEGRPLGFGLQGHNCGYRHRGFWTWTHAYFSQADGASTFEALVYDMPLGMVFRKAVLWHQGQQHVFRNLQEISRHPNNFRWQFRCRGSDGLQLEVAIDGGGPSLHRLAYVKTDCSGTFEVSNNSLAGATIRLKRPSGEVEELSTETGAVLEMVG